VTADQWAAFTPSPAPICVACVGDGFNPDGGDCLRCQGTGVDPDPMAPAGASPMTILRALVAKVSPDLDAYASGRLDISQVRCVLCGVAPCQCRQCEAPYLRWQADVPEPCGMTVGPDGLCPRGHRQDGGTP
jgi:hypothetical protein